MVTEVLNLSEALPRGPRTRGGTKVPQAGRKGSVIVIWAFNVTLYSKAPGARNYSSYKRKEEVKGVRVLALACTVFPPNAYVEAPAPRCDSVWRWGPHDGIGALKRRQGRACRARTQGGGV